MSKENTAPTWQIWRSSLFDRKAYRRQHYLRNKTKNRAQTKTWRANNRERYLSTSRKAAKQYRLLHPDVIRLRNRQNHERNYQRRREFIDSLRSRPCADCGVQYPPCVMDFDHVRGVKSFQISGAIYRSRASILAEVAKCDVVCANCHRMRTHAMGGPLKAGMALRAGTQCA